MIPFGDLIFATIASVTALLQVANFLDDCEFEDYINETGWWATQQAPQEQQEPLVSKGTKNMENVANVVGDNFEASSGDIEVSQSL